MNHYLYSKDYDLSIGTFSFNMRIFDQWTHFHLIGTFSVNRHVKANFGAQAQQVSGSGPKDLRQ